MLRRLSRGVATSRGDVRVGAPLIAPIIPPSIADPAASLDQAVAVEIADDGTLVVARRSRVAGGAGAVARLSPDAQQLLLVTPMPGEVHDLDLDRARERVVVDGAEVLAGLST
jgi:hypothetical protein